jgi:hypothetical protein
MVSCQLVPTVLGEMMKDPDRDRVTKAMLEMKKFDPAPSSRPMPRQSLSEPEPNPPH